MNTRVAILMGLTLLTATACVRSLDPFCPAAAQAPRPDLDGIWHETDGAGAIEPGQRLTFTGDTIVTTNDAKQVQGILKVAYFKAGDAWFADTTAGSLESGADDWWQIHTVPVHHVARLEHDGDLLRITPLDQDWLKAAIAATNGPAAYIRVADADQHLFSGRPVAWVELLGRIAADTNAFPPRRTIVLRRGAAAR